MRIDTLCPIQKVVAAGRPIRLFRCERCGTLEPHMRKCGDWFCLRVLDRSKRVICQKLYQEDHQP